MSTPRAEHEAALALLAAVPYGRLALTREALPHMAVTRHIVTPDGHLILRTHKGWDIHRSADGAVVAYVADNTASGQPEAWVVQLTGTAYAMIPSRAQRERFGEQPAAADGVPFEPVYLRIEPGYATSYRVSGLPQ
ncbi:pyridoxamine 5'-phosphate oxidase family protein [Streptomyces sp. NBC_01537]|uniref:pyridoxamine 5'-phosphate oxidase family protein n=1 Tax=Streptomyces sp. NBC_01537 TaxID=2903896 RepID=UPI00386469E6